MTTWVNTTKNSSAYSNSSKSSSSYSNQSKSSSSATYFQLLIDDTYKLLIDGTYFLNIGDSSDGGSTQWSNQTKN